MTDEEVETLQQLMRRAIDNLAEANAQLAAETDASA